MVTNTPTRTPTPAHALAVMKEIAADAADLYYYNSLVKGDWTYWDARARNPSALAQDLWIVPSGRMTVGMAALDDYLFVMKREGAYDLNLYLYNGLVAGDWRYGEALARNPSPAARDLWIVPSGNDALGIATVDITAPPDGTEELAVLKMEGAGDMNIYYYNAPLPADRTYWDAFSRNPSPLARDLWVIPGGNSASGIAVVDAAGGVEQLAIIRRDGADDLNLYLYNNLLKGDWTYWDAVSRNPSALARDLWIIPSGNNAAGMAAVYAGGGWEYRELAIFKEESGDSNLYYYSVPVAGDWTYWDARARNPSPLARDLWVIPAGNDTVSIAAPR